MIEVIGSGDCGNSPKQKFVEDIAIALARGDADFLVKSVTDDVVWNAIGGKVVEGKENLAALVKRSSLTGRKRIVIQHVVSHGRKGAANGRVEVSIGEPIDFCCIIEFKNTKCTSVKQLITYTIGGQL